LAAVHPLCYREENITEHLRLSNAALANSGISSVDVQRWRDSSCLFIVIMVNNARRSIDGG